MDPLDCTNEDLLRFFHTHKTEISCMENPQTFFRQLLDHDLIPKARYKKLSCVKSKEKLKNDLYNILDWLERKRPQDIRKFWTCVFRKPILNQYPALKQMQDDLSELSKTKKTEETNDQKRKDLSYDEEKEEEQMKKKIITRKRRESIIEPPDFKEEKKGKEQSLDPGHKSEAPVTCGDLEAEPNKDKLAKGSYCFDAPESEDMEEMDEKKRKQLSEDEEEEEQKSSVKKKRKQIRKSVCNDEEEQPGPSSQLTPGQRKQNKKISFSSPLKKGEKSEVWTWTIFKSQLPVTCGNQEGTLNRDRLAKGEKCILSQKQWFTPSEFEKFAGKRSKNWKTSIRCHNTPLGKLIQEGHLKSAKYTGGRKKAKKSLFPSDHLIAASCEEENDDEEEGDQEDQDSSSNKESSTNVTDEEEEAEEQAEQQSEDNQDRNKIVFKVTCGAAAGTLHKKRFGSETCGKSIRTETKWMTPVEFVKEASSQTDVCWKKDIKWEGKPLGVLIEEKILVIHSLLCPCRLCKPDAEDLKNRENDDECCICKCDEEAELVVCDHCPRSFHQKCHLPHVDDTDFRDDRPWVCTFCVFRNTQAWPSYSDQPDMTTVLSYQISQHMLECQYLLLYLRSADEEQTFALNPTLYLERYSTVVQTPMWLGKVAEKLQENEYGTVGEFVFDVQLIFTNCTTYSRDNAVFRSLGEQLKEVFDGEFKKVFNICEPTVG